MITRSIKGSLFLAGGLIAAALLLTLTADQGWIGENMDTRITQALIGAILMLFGNVAAKRQPGEKAGDEPRPGFNAARRFFGLVLVIGGLLHALAWLFAPLDMANWLSMAAVGLALAIGLVRLFATLARPPASPR